MSLTLAVPPAPNSPLARTLDAVVEWLNDPGQDWPSSLPVAASADAGLIARRLRMAAAWAGQVRARAPSRPAAAPPRSTVELVGEHATVTLVAAGQPGHRRAPPGRRNAMKNRQTPSQE